MRERLIALTCVSVLAGGPPIAIAQAPAGSGVSGPKVTRSDLNFSIAAPSDEWTWEEVQPHPDSWVFKATHLPTRSQAVLAVVPSRGPLQRAVAEDVVAGMVESIAGRQSGLAETGRSVSPSQVPRPGSFRFETWLRNEAQGIVVRAWGYIFADGRLFSLVVLSAHDSGEQALESMIGSFRFLREPPIASRSSSRALTGATRSGFEPVTAGGKPAAGLGVLYLLLVLLLAGLGWLVNKLAGRPLWDAARTALVLLLILLVIQIASAVSAGGSAAGRSVGSAVGTALVPLLVAAWFSRRFQKARTKASPSGEGGASA